MADIRYMFSSGISFFSPRLQALACLLFAFVLACAPAARRNATLPVVVPFSGTAFYQQAAGYGWQQRDSLAVAWILAGHFPDFLQRFTKVHAYLTDSSTGKRIHAWYYVSPDYLSVGTNTDWARIPLTPMAVARVAAAWNCQLPTRKMVNDIYAQARVKLEPIPLYAYRDSTPTLWHHHLMIEGQRQGRKGLIAGIKKDVVLSNAVHAQGRSNRVAIYGWHRLNGQPIQPLYAGHVNWYVDYSHGIRLVQNTMYVNGQPMSLEEVLQHPVYYRLVWDEAALLRSAALVK